MNDLRLFDSNILIYASKPDYQELRLFLATQRLNLSAISKAEVFGFPKLKDEEKELLEQLFSLAHQHPISDPVIDETVRLRQQRNIKTVDAIIASTAILLGAELVTRNTEDFKWIAGLRLFDPFEKGVA